MNLHFEASAGPELPRPVGAHRLAWSYLLDAVVADAYHAGTGQLRVDLPAALEPELAQRCDLSTRPGADASAHLMVAGTPLPDRALVRFYRLRFGQLAPGLLRNLAAPAPAGMRLEQRLFVYTLTARLWGIPMRLFNMARQPHLADRALVAVRRNFASERPVPAFYVLERWR